VVKTMCPSVEYIEWVLSGENELDWWGENRNARIN